MHVYSREYPRSDNRHIETCRRLKAMGILHISDYVSWEHTPIIITVHYAPPNALAFLKHLNFEKEDSDEPE